MKTVADLLCSRKCDKSPNHALQSHALWGMHMTRDQTMRCRAMRYEVCIFFCVCPHSIVSSSFFFTEATNVRMFLSLTLSLWFANNAHRNVFVVLICPANLTIRLTETMRWRKMCGRHSNEELLHVCYMLRMLSVFMVHFCDIPCNTRVFFFSHVHSLTF